MKNVNASRGIFAGLQAPAETEKQTPDPKGESKIKRSYDLKESTIKKLQELKVFSYGPNMTYNDIVDEAVCQLYERKANPKK